MYCCIHDLWGPINLVASWFTETEAILPYLMGVHRDSAWTRCPSRDHVEDMDSGEVGPDRLLDRVMNCGHSRCLHDSCVSCCQVYTLVWCTTDLNLCDTDENG
jgi:hypothetical protein